MSSSGPSLYHSEPDFALAGVRNVFVVIFRVNTTLVGARRVHETCSSFATDYPDGIGLLTIVEQSAPMPPNEARDRLAQFMREGEYIRASAVSFEGTGFRAAAVRSVVAGLALLARQRFPHKIFPTLDTASDWLIPALADFVPVDYDAPTFVREVQGIRQQVNKGATGKREETA